MAASAPGAPRAAKDRTHTTAKETKGDIDQDGQEQRDRWLSVVARYAAQQVVGVRDCVCTMLQNILIQMLRTGPLPRRMAFIMDGKRRWSRIHGMQVREGHEQGFEALKRVLEACMALERIEMVTVYAFAIDNFKRDQHEVDALMRLAKARLLELHGHGEVVSRYSVRVRVMGQRHLLPHDVQDAIFQIEEATRYNTGATLNICMPYASQNEIAHAAAAASAEAQPITRKSLEAHLMVPQSIPVDILVRTSCVSRLSDFMLWQCNEHTQLHFVDQFWPMFGVRDLIPILLQYQRFRLFGM